MVTGCSPDDTATLSWVRGARSEGAIWGSLLSSNFTKWLQAVEIDETRNSFAVFSIPLSSTALGNLSSPLSRALFLVECLVPTEHKEILSSGPTEEVEGEVCERGKGMEGV